MIRLAFSLTLVLQMLLASSSSFAARSVPSMVQRRRMPLWRGGSSIPNDGDDSTNPFSRIGSSPEDPPPTIDGSVDAANPTFTASPILTTAEQSSPDFNHSGAVVGASTKNTSSTRTPGFLRSQFPNFPWHSIPNWLTFLRCLAVPALLAAFYAPGPHSRVATSTLFATAAATDFLDGYLARRWDVSSAFGAFLDPVVSGSLGQALWDSFLDDFFNDQTPSCLTY